jgi:hypothetical protein
MAVLKSISIMKNVIVVSLSVFILFVACRSQDNSFVSQYSRHRAVDRVLSDSVVLHDSIFIRERADTVYFTKYRTLYKEVMRHDTVVVCDTVFTERIVTMERKSYAGFGWIGVLSAVVLLILLWRLGLIETLWNLISKK